MGRTLPFVSMLARAQSEDESEKELEDLAQALEFNWLWAGKWGRIGRAWWAVKEGVVGWLLALQALV